MAVFFGGLRVPWYARGMRKAEWGVFGLVVLLVSLSPGAAAAQEVGESVTVRENQSGDFYAAGQEVVLQGDVEGDAVLAGGTVRVTGAVSEDLIAAGGTVNVTGDVADDVRLAGGEVTLGSNVGGHAVISGGSVVVESDATIQDWAWLAGGSVEVEGVVNGELRVAAGEIEISGRVEGDVDLAGGEIEIEDGAVINGNLTWRSSAAPEIGAGVTISGDVIEGEPIPGLESEPSSAWLQGLFTLLTLIVSAGVFYTLFRVPLGRCVSGFHARRGRTLWIGLAVLLGTPIAIVLLFATGIGWLLGLMLLTTYVLAVAAGGLTGIILIARWGLERFRAMPDPSLGAAWGAIAAAALLLVLLSLIPLLGGLVTFLVMLAGLGAVAIEIYRALRGDTGTRELPGG